MTESTVRRGCPELGTSVGRLLNHAAGDVGYVVLDGPVWVVTDHAEIDRLLRGKHVFKEGHHELARATFVDERMTDLLCRRSAVLTDSETHQRLRRVMNGLWHTKAADGIMGRIDELSSSLVRSFPSGCEVDVLEALAYPLPIRVIGELLGTAHALDADVIRKWTETFIGLVSLDMTATASDPAAAQPMVAAADKLLSELLDEREPGDDDFLGVLRAAEENGTMTRDESLANLIFLHSAGFETTAGLIASSIVVAAELAEREPDAPPKRLATSAVEIALRANSPVQYVPYYAGDDVVIGGRPVPADTSVILALGAADLDDADDHARPTLAFGAGPHYCLGARIARAEARAATEAVLAQHRGYRLAPRSGRWDRTSFVRRPLRLRIHLHPPTEDQ